MSITKKGDFLMKNFKVIVSLVALLVASNAKPMTGAEKRRAAKAAEAAAKSGAPVTQVVPVETAPVQAVPVQTAPVQAVPVQTASTKPMTGAEKRRAAKVAEAAAKGAPLKIAPAPVQAAPVRTALEQQLAKAAEQAKTVKKLMLPEVAKASELGLYSAAEQAKSAKQTTAKLLEQVAPARTASMQPMTGAEKRRAAKAAEAAAKGGAPVTQVVPVQAVPMTITRTQATPVTQVAPAKTAPMQPMTGAEKRRAAKAAEAAAKGGAPVTQVAPLQIVQPSLQSVGKLANQPRETLTSKIKLLGQKEAPLTKESVMQQLENAKNWNDFIAITDSNIKVFYDNGELSQPWFNLAAQMLKVFAPTGTESEFMDLLTEAAKKLLLEAHGGFILSPDDTDSIEASVGIAL
jgi:hypothetical protein